MEQLLSSVSQTSPAPVDWTHVRRGVNLTYHRRDMIALSSRLHDGWRWNRDPRVDPSLFTSRGDATLCVVVLSVPNSDDKFLGPLRLVTNSGTPT